MNYCAMDLSNEKFMGDIDRHITATIEEKLRQNPYYFTAVIGALEIMPYLEAVIIPTATREEIFCICKNDGNTRAVRKMIETMKRFQNFGLSFLQALLGTGHRNLAEDLISGFRINARCVHPEASFIRGLLGVSPPPYYIASTDDPFQEQHEKLSRFNSVHQSVGPTLRVRPDDISTLSTIRSDDISLSNPSTSSSTVSHNYPPPYGSLEQNLMSSNTSSAQTGSNSGSSLINNEPVHDGDHSMTRHPVENDVEGWIQHQVVTSDLHLSEFCVSGDSRAATIPKEIVSQTEASEIENDSERLDAIVPNASVGVSMSNALTGSTRHEQQERIIEDSTHNVKNYSAPEVEDVAESLQDVTSNSSSLKNDVPNEYLWEIAIGALAVISVIAFLMKRK